MRWLASLLLLFALTSPAFAQGYVLGVAGDGSHGCEPVLPPILPELEWIDANGVHTDRPGDVLGVAPASGGRVYAVIAAPIFTAFYIAEIRPNGSTRQLTAAIPGFAAALVVDGAGAFYVLHLPPAAGPSDVHLLAFNADGTPRAGYALGDDYIASPFGGGPYAFSAMDLAADQCTLFLIRGNGIRRFNACTGTFLPDFATVQLPIAHALRVLPDGGVIVSTSNGFNVFQLERYTAGGAFVTAYSTPGPVAAMLPSEGGTHLLFGEFGCAGGQVIDLDLAAGTRQPTQLEFVENPGTIVAANGWTAAIGATNANDIPAAGTIGLIGTAVLLLAVALMRLR